MKFFFSVVLSIAGFVSVSQNLVNNSGFERYANCPGEYIKPGQVFKIPGWYSPTSATPDYFNTCSDSDCNANVNWAGINREHNGNGYTGIIAFMTSKDYREYLAAELLKPLDSGETYLLQFNFRLSSYSLISSGNLGMAFAEQRVDERHDKMLNRVPVLIAMRDSAIVKKTGNWQTASGTYMANGKERHLLIGNFFSHQKNPVYEIKFGGDNEPMLRYASYFYIDDVVVRSVKGQVVEMTVVENPFKSDSLITLRNVLFAYNSTTIMKGSEAELDKLMKFLQSNISARVEILGHTDDQGTDEYNKQLSLRRASAVVEIIAKAGVDKKRLTAFGFGKTRPLIKATDEKARAINRRVEVRLVK